MAIDHFKLKKGLTLDPQVQYGISDPAGNDGDIYYNSALDKFRKFQSGAWSDMDTTGTSNFLISQNDSAGTGGLTVFSGTSVFNPYLDIVSADTYTVNTDAELISVTVLTINGTLVVNGTGEVRVL